MHALLRFPPYGLAKDNDRSQLIDLRRRTCEIASSYKEEGEIHALVHDYMRPVAEVADEKDYGDDRLMIGRLVS